MAVLNITVPDAQLAALNANVLARDGSADFAAWLNALVAQEVRAVQLAAAETAVVAAESKSATELKDALYAQHQLKIA